MFRFYAVNILSFACIFVFFVAVLSAADRLRPCEIASWFEFQHEAFAWAKEDRECCQAVVYGCRHTEAVRDRQIGDVVVLAVHDNFSFDALALIPIQK